MNDNNNVNPKSCNRLEEIANEARKKLLTENIYQNETGKSYDSRHPNANQSKGGVDDRQNAKGKGTGQYMDSSNGGGSADISARTNALLKNKYTKDKPYDCFIN
jgi:hypothetical protein